MRRACGVMSRGGSAAGCLRGRLLRAAHSRAVVELPDEVAHLRVHDLAPAPAAEDAVVARALHLEVLLARLGHAGAQIVRGFGLAAAGDVVEFALDREVRR